MFLAVTFCLLLGLNSTTLADGTQAEISEVIRRSPFLCERLLKLISTPSSSYPPKVMLHLLYEFNILPELSSNSSRNCDEGIAEIFVEWLGTQKEIIDKKIKSRDALRTLFARFQEEQNALFEKMKPELLKYIEEVQEGIRSEKPLRRIVFSKRNWDIIRMFPESREAEVSLVRADNGQIRVLKKYRFRSDLEEQVVRLQRLTRNGVSAGQIIEIDRQSNSLLMTYYPGITAADVEWLEAQGRVPPGSHFAYHYQHDVWEKTIPPNTRSEIVGIFNPHPENVIYDPGKDSRTIIDIR